MKTMKIDNSYDVLTFMSWDEFDYYAGEHIRAIALCDGTDYFVEAINAPRDSQMGEKDDYGVYPRTWKGDYIDNGDASDVRPATADEVDLYLRYCPLEKYSDMDHEDVCILNVVRSPRRSFVVVRYHTPWWKKLWRKTLAIFGILKQDEFWK